MRGRCKLCRREAELRRSHIVSRFAVRDAQGDAPSRLIRISSVEAPRLPRDQAWDLEHLLCGDCEERCRSWEAIVAGTMAGRGDGREQRPSLRVDEAYPDRLVQMNDVRYGPVKLWVLSTVYVMHHATKPDWAGLSLTLVL